MGPHKSVTERLSEHAARHLSARNSDSNSKAVCGKSLSVPLSSNTSDLHSDQRKPLGEIQIRLPIPHTLFSTIIKCVIFIHQPEHALPPMMDAIHRTVTKECKNNDRLSIRNHHTPLK